MKNISYLLSIPNEVLENIAFELAMLDPLSTSIPLVPLLCTCSHIYERINVRETKQLYARIFQSKFDVGSLERRSEDDSQVLRSSNLAKLLVDTSVALQRISHCEVDHPHVTDILWVAYILMMENDGKNRCQLERAGIDAFLDKFIRERMCAGVSGSWPSDDTSKCLALWLLWMTTTKEKLSIESAQKRYEIIEAVLPYVLLTFRYPTAHAPPNYFIFPTIRAPNHQFFISATTAHGSYPIYRNLQAIQCKPLRSRPLVISPPLITTAARLIYFSRREVVPFGIPPNLPRDREHATQLGFHFGPTQADIGEFNSHTDTRLVPETSWDSWSDRSERELADDFREPSERWDDDWRRVVYCINPLKYRPYYGTLYRPGLLNGLWQGRMLVPSETKFMQLLESAGRPSNFSETNSHVTTVPLYMRLREHHSISPAWPASMGGRHHFDQGLQSGYLPTVNLKEAEGNVTLSEGARTWTYETYVPGRPNSHNPATCLTCREAVEPLPDNMEQEFAAVGLGRDQQGEDWGDQSDNDNETDGESEDEALDFPDGMRTPKNVLCNGIQDIIFTGETDLRHSLAWNGFTFVGRVRRWDGLIAIVRTPIDRRLGRMVFYGYVVGEQNFVGTWRVCGVGPVGVPCWEGAFSMSRRSD